MTPMLWLCLLAYRQLTLAVRHGLIGRLKFWAQQCIYSDGGFAAWRDYAPGNIETGAFVAPEPGNFVASFNPEFYIGTSDVAHLPPTLGKRCWLMAAPMSNFMLAANIQKRQKLAGYHQPS